MLLNSAQSANVFFVLFADAACLQKSGSWSKNLILELWSKIQNTGFFKSQYLTKHEI